MGGGPGGGGGGGGAPASCPSGAAVMSCGAVTSVSFGPEGSPCWQMANNCDNIAACAVATVNNQGPGDQNACANDCVACIENHEADCADSGEDYIPASGTLCSVQVQNAFSSAGGGGALLSS